MARSRVFLGGGSPLVGLGDPTGVALLDGPALGVPVGYPGVGDGRGDGLAQVLDEDRAHLDDVPVAVDHRMAEAGPDGRRP